MTGSVPKHWWQLIAAGGGLILGAAMAANLIPLVHVGLGLFLIGVGEWINHPLQTKVGVNFTITGYPRRFTFLGTVFDAIGLVFFGYGSYRLLLI